MIAEHDHSDDVEKRDGPDLETGDYIVVDVVFDEGRAGMDHAEGEFQEVEDDEGQDDGAAPIHGSGSIGGMEIGFFDVVDGPGLALEEPELECGPDVQQYGDEQDDAGAPEEEREGFQGSGVMIDFFGRLVNLQIAEEMDDDEAEKNGAGDGHDGFFADGGLPEAQGARRKMNRWGAHGMSWSFWLFLL